MRRFLLGAVLALAIAPAYAQDISNPGVRGPSTSTNGDVATFNGTGGNAIQDGGKGLPTGAIVGTTDSQTLTNKTLTSPAINTPVVSGGTIDNAVIGGTTRAAVSGTTGNFNSTLTTNVTGSTQCLQANSSGVVSGTGASCATAVSPKLNATLITTAQSLSGVTKIQFNSINVFGTTNYWDGVNFWYKPLIAGTYMACGSVYGGGVNVTMVVATISKNGTFGSGGTPISEATTTANSVANQGATAPCELVTMNGSTDTLELDATISATSSPVANAVRTATSLTIYLVP